MNRFVMATFIVLVLVSFVLGTRVGPSLVSESVVSEPVPELKGDYSSGWQDREFFERAYEKAQESGDRFQPARLNDFSRSGGVTGEVPSILSAHHLLVADKMAQVFDLIATDEPVTLVLVGPNHFGVGTSTAQVSFGSWETPYGIVETDVEAAKQLMDAVPSLKHEEQAFAGEHSIGALTPFVARSLPNAKIVPIIVHDTGSPDAFWVLGHIIAKTFPDAILVASVDMAHYMDADATAAVDKEVLARLDRGWMCDEVPCTEDVYIDSNASIRVLAGFNEARGNPTWHLTHHGSSLGMGATRNPEENTSHVLGYFEKGF